MTQKDLNLLPHYFKKVAWVMIVLSVAIAVLSIAKIIPFDKEFIKQVSKNGLLVSLLLLALAKNKVEDELTIKLKLKAFTASFIYGVVVVIITPVINLATNGNFFSDKGVTELLMSMFIFYFIMLFIMKKAS